jgi:ribonuclease BN (tRNA processing enzyme)
LPDLIMTPWVLGRRVPLEVFGPPGISSMTEHLLAAYKQDIDIRMKGSEPANTTGWRVRAREIQPGAVYQDGPLTVEAFPVKHGSWMAFGYRFQTPERSIVISGDTAPTQSIIEMSQGCDLLVHEVYSVTGLATLDRRWQSYHSQMHTSSRELAEIARRTRPGLLVLYHQLFWGTPEEVLLSEIQQEYDGPVVPGQDLGVY